MKSIVLFAATLAALAAPAAEAAVWNAADGFAGWGGPYRCGMRVGREFLTLDVTGRDSSIRLSAKITARKYGAIEVDYRMTGIPAENNGEIYFAPAGEDFSEKRVLRFRDLATGTDWRTLRVPISGDAEKAWRECGTVAHLRLDLVNQAPGRIDIREIRLQPRLPELADSREIRRARKFPAVKSEIPAAPPRTAPPERPYYSGHMLKAREDKERGLPPHGARFAFRREFALDELPVKARIHIGADDAYAARINGRNLRNSGSWSAPDIQELGPEWFAVGRNRLTGVYWNQGGPGGVYFQLELLMPDNTIRRIVSDEATLFAPTGRSDWGPPPDGAAYAPPEPQPLPPGGQWKRVLPFRPLLPAGLNVTKNVFPAETESGKRYIWELAFSGVTAAPDARVALSLENASGPEVAVRTFRVAEVRGADGVWRIPVTTPKFLPSGKMRLKLLSAQVILPETVREFACVNTRKKGPDCRARVRGGEVYLNGKRTMPFLGHTQGVQNYAEAGFHRAGVELRGFVAKIYDADRWWRGPGEYDFSTVDARINTILSLDETAGIVVYLPTTPPKWWSRLHPGEMARRNDGTFFNDHESKASFASAQYRKDAGDAVAAFIAHMREAPYSDRIAGYVILGGVTYEWIQWGVFDYRRFTDYSAPARKRFAEYLKRHAPELSPELPTPAEQRDTAFGLFLNPETNRRTVLFNRFMSDMVAECIETLVGRARKAAGEEKLIGVYYGYLLACSNMGKLLNGSHGALRRILDCPDVDFLLCPMAYAVRNLGDCGEDGMPFAAIRAAGKMPVVEDDIRTHLQGVPQPYYQTPTAWLTEQVIRRSLGRILSRNQMAEFYALTTGREFASEAVQRDFRAFRKAAKFIVDRDVKARPEIAVVVSSRGYDYLAQYKRDSLIWHWEYESGTAKPVFVPHLRKLVSGELVGFQRTVIAKLGAPVDYLLAEDLGRVADRPYKLWIFLNQFDTTPELDAALKKIRARKGTCLFMYAPGVFRDDRIDFANMEKLTGIKLRVKTGGGLNRVTFPERKVPETAQLRYRGMGTDHDLPLLFEAVSGQQLATYPDGKVGVAMTRVGATKSIFCGVTKLSADFLRSLAADAGVWIYSDSEDVLFASDAFITLHAAEEGRKVLKFPRAVDVADVFTGKVLARGVREYAFDAKMLETRVFYYGSSAADFCKTINDPNI